MRVIKKTYYVILRNIIKVIDCFDARKYMRIYNWYLKKIGINIHGIPRFIHPSVNFDGKGYEAISIGDNDVISRNVLFLVHDYSITCGLRSAGERIVHEAYYLKKIEIKDNVFIGANVTILPGTIIERNCIIGAGAIIKGHIPENSIVIGNPSKVVGKTSEWAKRKILNNDIQYEKNMFKK